MNNDTVIKVENVSKKYCKSLKKSMIYGVKDIAKNSIGLSARSERLRKSEFWAVDDVSFEVKRGETLGIIGPNGAGKTTLLKMLNGIFWPDKGKITVKGKAGALIALGAGFHPLLAGRENIYINGAILGMNKKEIDKKIDSIVDFADIGDFIDTPVKNYSSGMYVRLGFAIAIHCEPDILLIDEILAVGDLPFRVKCFNRMEELSKNCAIVIVSHNMSALARIATKCIVLNRGNSCFQGSSEKAIQYYCSLFEEEMKTKHLAGSKEAKVDDVKLSKNSRETDTFEYGNSMTISFNVEVSSRYKTFLVSLSFINQRMEIVAQCDSRQNNVILNNDGNTKTIYITIPELLLTLGKYSINITVFDETHQKYLYWSHNAKMFKVTGEFIGNASIHLLSTWKIQ